MQHDEGFRHWAQSLLFRKCDRQPGSGMLRAQAFETKSKQLRAEVHYQRGRLAHARGPAWRVDKKVKGNVHCIARLEDRSESLFLCIGWYCTTMFKKHIKNNTFHLVEAPMNWGNRLSCRSGL